MGKGTAAAVVVVLLVAGVVGLAVYVGNNPVSRAAGSLYQKGQGVGGQYLNSGQATIYVQDPPDYSPDVSSIVIAFSSIDMHSTNGSWITVSGTQTSVDLMKVIGLPEDLGTFRIPAGTYDQLRFMVDEAQATISGQTVLLQIPSGGQTGLKVAFPNDLVLSAGGGASIYVDITADNNALHSGLLIPTLTASMGSS